VAFGGQKDLRQPTAYLMVCNLPSDLNTDLYPLLTFTLFFLHSNRQRGGINSFPLSVSFHFSLLPHTSAPSVQPLLFAVLVRHCIFSTLNRPPPLTYTLTLNTLDLTEVSADRNNSQDSYTMSGQLRCDSGEWKARREFSGRQLEKYDREARAGRANPSRTGIRCLEHANMQNQELECCGPCGRTRDLRLFSKSTRRNGTNVSSRPRC